jgi:hypothetical protein
MFGIDVRWAGVFVAALLVVLISAPALLRRPATTSAAPASIPARIVDAGPEEKAAGAPGSRRETRAEPVRQAAAPPPAAAPAPPPMAAKDEAAAKPPSAPAAIVAEAPAEEEKARAGFAAAPRAKAAAPALRKRTTATDLAGGEAGAVSAMDSETVAAPPRLTVRALDGQGAPPALASPVSDARFAPLRGSEFVIVVETQGRVRSVQPSSGDGFLERTDALSAPAKQTEALEALRALRFAPGDRPRRLVVRIE